MSDSALDPSDIEMEGTVPSAGSLDYVLLCYFVRNFCTVSRRAHNHGLIFPVDLTLCDNDGRSSKSSGRDGKLKRVGRFVQLAQP